MSISGGLPPDIVLSHGSISFCLSAHEVTKMSDRIRNTVKNDRTVNASFSSCLVPPFLRLQDSRHLPFPFFSYGHLFIELLNRRRSGEVFVNAFVDED
jgi:hypothetical protein